MGASIETFIGSWKITGATSEQGSALENDGYILIGTNSGWGDSEPSLTKEGFQTVVGFAVVNNGQIATLSDIPLSSGSHQGQQPLLFLLDNGVLRWSGYFGQVPVRIFVSAASFIKANGTNYVALYGTTIQGDPEQVGVWGGSGSPPPQPPPETA